MVRAVLAVGTEGRCMTELELQTRIRIALGRAAPHARLFRNAVAQAWTGRLLSADQGIVTLARAQRIQAGLAPGSADLVGWTSIEVTPDMVGRRIAIFTSAEVKTTRGRVEEGQEHWLRVVAEAGGLSGVVRSEDDALQLVTHR